MQKNVYFHKPVSLAQSFKLQEIRPCTEISTEAKEEDDIYMYENEVPSSVGLVLPFPFTEGL